MHLVGDGFVWVTNLLARIIAGSNEVFLLFRWGIPALRSSAMIPLPSIPRERHVLPGNLQNIGRGNLTDGLRSYLKLGTTGEDCDALSDQELVLEIAESNRRALEELYARFSGPIYSLAVRMLRDPGAAEEVTQDTFFNVWKQAGSYKPERGKVTAWLFSICRHRVIDEIRRRKRREQTHVHQDVELADQPADDTNDPTRFANLRMQRGMLKEALSKLRAEQRVVIELAYFGGLTHSEIASRLGQPLGTVKTRMRLGLRKLREVVGPQAREWV